MVVQHVLIGWFRVIIFDGGATCSDWLSSVAFQAVLLQRSSHAHWRHQRSHQVFFHVYLLISNLSRGNKYPGQASVKNILIDSDSWNNFVHKYFFKLICADVPAREIIWSSKTESCWSGLAWIYVILGSWTRIRIRLWVKIWIRIRIKVKIQELSMLNMEEP